MALLNPVYGLILPFLFIFTIPIAIIATITTTIAFSILIFRVSLVYVELAFAVIPYWLLGPKPASALLHRGKPTSSPPPTLPSRRKKRRSSTSSTLSATGSISPISGDNVMGISQSIGATRDYEGVGGWRLGDPSDDEDSLWTKINSRLELPADHGRRHHQRSHTSGSVPDSLKVGRAYSPEAIMNTSRPRTPTSTTGPLSEGYFPQTPISTKASRKMVAGNGASGSSGSSKG